MISDLSFITLDDLCNSLEKPTRNWEELMQSNIFRYPDRVINKIREKDHPAKALMDEFSCQMTTLQDLLSGLKEIGNKKAISIIEKELNMSHGFNAQDSSGRPPPSQCITRQPQEHSMAPVSSTHSWELREQVESLMYPVEESGRNGEIRRPRNPGFHGYMQTVFSILCCFY